MDYRGYITKKRICMFTGNDLYVAHKGRMRPPTFGDTVATSTTQVGLHREIDLHIAHLNMDKASVLGSKSGVTAPA